MATLEERKGSGDGDAVGLEVKRRTRAFTLIVDAVTDDWYDKFKALLPEGSSHPKDKSMQLTEHTNISREAPLGYIVSATYESKPDVGVSGFGQWLLSARSATGSERLFQEIADPNNAGAERKVVGPLRYVKFEGEGTPPGTYFVARAFKDGAVFNQILTAAPGIHRPDGMDIVSGGTSIALSRTFTKFDATKLLLAANFKRGVNLKRFISNTFRERTLLFLDFSIDETIGRVPNSRVDRFLYEVTLEFLYQQGGHTPLRRTDTFDDGNGFESVVKTSGGAEVTQEFRRYPEQDFDALVGLFDR